MKLFRKKLFHSNIFLKVLKIHFKVINYREFIRSLLYLECHSKSFIFEINTEVWNTQLKSLRVEVDSITFQHVGLSVSGYNFPCSFTLLWSPTQSHDLQAEMAYNKAQQVWMPEAWRIEFPSDQYQCLPSSLSSSIHATTSWRDHLWEEH